MLHLLSFCWFACWAGRANRHYWRARDSHAFTSCLSGTRGRRRATAVSPLDRLLLTLWTNNIREHHIADSRT
ncbi:hypothetical protein BX600DRAFT_452827 [Xylariales sp. PMI_506]|nr:hypothetical protein BX600DRAFT_452827 [Xylariales sp. PMI_506]